MKHYKLLFFLAFSSVFTTKGSMIPVHATNSYTASNGPTVTQDFINQFKPVQCTGSFYEHDNIIILEKKDTTSLIVICAPQIVTSELNKNQLLQLVANRNKNKVQSIITYECIGYGLASCFQEHILKNPSKIDSLVSLSKARSQENSFVFFVNDFQIIARTPHEKIIKRNDEIKNFMFSLLKMGGTIGCIYLFISFIFPTTKL